MRINIYFIALVCFLFTACISEKEQSSKTVIKTNDYGVLKGLIELIDIELLEYEGLANQMKIPKKVLSWGDDYVYQNWEGDMTTASVFILNEAFEPQRVIQPNSGGPGSLREITDFFIWKNELHLYDFQSQKFVIYNKNLNDYREVRSGFYYNSFAVTDSLLVAYGGKKVQRVGEELFPFDLMVLGDQFRPVNYFKPFDNGRFNGSSLNTERSLLSNGNEVFFTEFWSDTVLTIQKDKIMPAYTFAYETPLPEEVKSARLNEIITGMMQQKYVAYEKGAAPYHITDDLILYSFGSKDRLKNGIYNRRTHKSITFRDYDQTLLEQLFKPHFYENGIYTTFMYPYEMLDYLYNDLFIDVKVDDKLFAKLQEHNPDGSLVKVSYSISNEF